MNRTEIIGNLTGNPESRIVKTADMGFMDIPDGIADELPFA